MSNNPEASPGQATSPGEETPPGLLPVTYQDLQKSNEVDWAVQQSPEPIPNDPHQRVATYLSSLVGRHGLMGGSEERRQAQVAHHVMDEGDIPESYFDRQREIARQEGHGDIEIDHEMRQQLSEALIADQTASLNAWAEYLNDPDADDYPAWFRYYTMRNVLKLADYDKEKERFRKRSNKTTAPYPELNREALAYVYDTLNRRLEGQEQNDEQTQELAQQANFNKLYSHALAECVPSDPEQLQTTAGEWTTYQKLDPEEGTDRAHQLAQSLQGYGTGWCTAGESTAEMHLRKGDFYVYYSYDEDGQATVPRAIVRMEHGEVAEVRGIEANQHLEPAMTDITMERVKDLPGGQEYLQAAEDMNRVTDIETRVRQGQELTAQDVYFLYEFGDGYTSDIQGFGYDRDPRIDELLQDRDASADVDMMMEEFDHTQLARDMIGNGAPDVIDQNLDKFLQSEAVDKAQLAWDVMHNGRNNDVIARNLDKFLQSEDVDPAQLARDMMDSKNLLVRKNLAEYLDKFPPDAIDQTELARDMMQSRVMAGNVDLVKNLDKFQDGAVDQAELARSLMRNGFQVSVVRNLDKFQEGAVDQAKLAHNLMTKREYNVLVENLEKFRPEAVDDKSLACNLFDSGEEGRQTLAENLHKFRDVPGDVQRRLPAAA